MKNAHWLQRKMKKMKGMNLGEADKILKSKCSMDTLTITKICIQ